jgi:malic enzyme
VCAPPLQAIGLPISKLALHTACGGIEPATCMPVVFDVGTDNEELLQSPLYVGVRHRYETHQHPTLLSQHTLVRPCLCIPARTCVTLKPAVLCRAVPCFVFPAQACAW